MTLRAGDQTHGAASPRTRARPRTLPVPPEPAARRNRLAPNTSGPRVRRRIDSASNGLERQAVGGPDSANAKKGDGALQGWTGKVWRGDTLELLKALPAESVDLIITDPPYDLPRNIQERYHAAMRRACRTAIIVFCPPENQWVSRPAQYLFWVKPISTKNTSRRYSRFVEMILIYGSGTFNMGLHWSNYVNVFHDYPVGERPAIPINGRPVDFNFRERDLDCPSCGRLPPSHDGPIPHILP